MKYRSPGSKIEEIRYRYLPGVGQDAGEKWRRMREKLLKVLSERCMKLEINFDEPNYLTGDCAQPRGKGYHFIIMGDPRGREYEIRLYITGRMFQEFVDLVDSISDKIAKRKYINYEPSLYYDGEFWLGCKEPDKIPEFLGELADILRGD
ncbi:MAG: hypothetical protein DRP01_00640 [Archaeoglobales archaeon]|nr:MAG: hypothetical protein DRP01_00640 [Archaeoglobales archaeon]